MKNVLLGMVIAVLAAAALYFYNEAQSKPTSNPDFGQLSQLNRLVLAKQTITDRCTLENKDGFGKGIIVYDWAFEAGYGIDVPLNHSWQVKETAPGDFVITAPPLTQLHPVTVNFTDFIEKNEASGNRWETMYYDARTAAGKRLNAAIRYALEHNAAVTREAKVSAQKFFAQILTATLADKPVNSVTVNFKKSGKTGSKLRNSKSCD
jgi:hypothetical protein